MVSRNFAATGEAKTGKTQTEESQRTGLGDGDEVTLKNDVVDQYTFSATTTDTIVHEPQLR